MRTVGVVLTLCGAFVVAAVLHSKLQSAPSSQLSPSAPSRSGGGSNSAVGQFTVGLDGGGSVTVNATDAASALENAQQETGIVPVGLIG